MAANLQLLGSTLLATKGGPSAITPISYARTLTQKFGSEDLIDSAELAQRGPRMFRDWSELDSLYKKRQLTALSKMITAAALNEVNGALALFVRCSTLLYSYERNWLEFYQDVVLTAWPEHSPTSIPQGISFMGFTKEGRSTAYAASVEMPNAVLCDPNFGDTRLRHMLQGVNKTAAYTMQRNFATALCARPFYDFCDKHITAGGVSFEQVYNHMSQYFCTAAVNVAAMQLVLDEAIDKYPPKDTIVVPQGREWAFAKIRAEENLRFPARVHDMTGGELGRLVQDFTKLEFKPEGTYAKNTGQQGNVAIVKCPTFVALGFANEDTHGYQPLLRELRLAVAYEFPDPQLESRAADGRRIGVAVLNMRRNDSQYHIVRLADAIQQTRCGWIFGSNEAGSKDDSMYKAALTQAKTSQARLDSLKKAGAYETPTVEAQKAMRVADSYDAMVGWRDVPPGSDNYGNKAAYVLNIALAQLPTAYLVAGAKAFTRANLGKVASQLNQTFGLNGDVTVGALHEQERRRDENDEAEIARVVLFYYNYFNRVGAVAALDDAPAPAVAEVPAAGGRPAVPAIPGGPGLSTLLGEKEAVRLFSLLPDPSFERLAAWESTLKSLAKTDPANYRTIVGTLHDRIKAHGEDVARIDVHVRHGTAELERMGLTAGSPVKQPLPAEHVARFVASLPSPSVLAASKVVSRTDVSHWSKATSLAVGGIRVPAGGPAPFNVGLNAQLRYADLAPFFGELSDEEMAALAVFLTRPFTLETCVAMARIGVPIITGSIERWAQTFRCLSMLVLKSDEVCQTIMTPMRATLSAEGVRRITHFTFDFMMGQRWLNPAALVELPNMFPAEFVGGMNHRLITSLKEFHGYLKGVNYTTRADCIFVPRSVGEVTVDYPGNLFGEMWQKPDRMGEATEQVMYRTHSGHVLFRHYMQSQKQQLMQQMEETVRTGNGSTSRVQIQVVVERACTKRADDKGEYRIDWPGTGPLGPVMMNDPANSPHAIYNGSRGSFATVEAKSSSLF